VSSAFSAGKGPAERRKKEITGREKSKRTSGENDAAGKSEV